MFCCCVLLVGAGPFSSLLLLPLLVGQWQLSNASTKLWL